MANSKELDIEQLKNVAGGESDQQALYCLNRYIKAVNAKYEAWLEGNPNASKEEKRQIISYFMDEVYNSLSANEKYHIDYFKENYPILWNAIYNPLM